MEPYVVTHPNGMLFTMVQTRRRPEYLSGLGEDSSFMLPQDVSPAGVYSTVTTGAPKIERRRSNAKTLKQILPLVEDINELEPEFVAMEDEELRELAINLRARFADGETLDDLLPESFAVTRETAK